MTKVYIIHNPIKVKYYIMFSELNAFLADDQEPENKYTFSANIESAKQWDYAGTIIKYCELNNLKILG